MTMIVGNVPTLKQRPLIQDFFCFLYIKKLVKENLFLQFKTSQIFSVEPLLSIKREL